MQRAEAAVTGFIKFAEFGGVVFVGMLRVILLFGGLSGSKI